MSDEGQRTWDIGDPEPGPEVTGVDDYTQEGYDPLWDGPDSPQWGRTTDNGWKGYKNGGKTYTDWADLVRRWGPVTSTAKREESQKLAYEELAAVLDESAGAGTKNA